MRNRTRVFWLTITSLTAVAWGAFAADEPFTRSYDKEVEGMIENVADSEKRFEKALDRDFKGSVVRGQKGEVDVKNFLKDLRESIEKFDDRFDSKYSASAELQDVLTRASSMHAFMRNHQTLKGASEWDEVAANLSSLAVAYGTTFPLPDGAAVRRVGDKELTAAVNDLGKALGKVESALKKGAKGTPELEAQGKTGKTELETLEKNLKALKSRLGDHKPATAEGRTVLGQVDKIDAFMKNGLVPASVGTVWETAALPLAEKIAQAFGLYRGAVVR